MFELKLSLQTLVLPIRKAEFSIRYIAVRLAYENHSNQNWHVEIIL